MYQELIGELRWATEMGRVDILFELAILSAYQASPRQGHFDQLLKIYGYLKHKPKITLYLDPTRMPVPANVFKNNSHEFKEQYRDAKELLPYDMPKPRGNSVRIEQRMLILIMPQINKHENRTLDISYSSIVLLSCGILNDRIPLKTVRSDLNSLR